MNESHPLDPTNRVDEEIETAIHCKNCGNYYDENGFEISKKRAYDDCEVIEQFCCEECKEVY